MVENARRESMGGEDEGGQSLTPEAARAGANAGKNHYDVVKLTLFLVNTGEAERPKREDTQPALHKDVDGIFSCPIRERTEY